MKIGKKLLLAGGGHSDIPLIQAAQSLGYYVITTGNRPDDLGHRFSDDYQPADYSDCEAMLALATSLEVDAICPCCNDLAALSCAYVAEKLGLPGHDNYATCQLLHHKDSYRQFALANDIPTPKAFGLSEKDAALCDLSNLSLPVIVKPIDMSGGKGIARAETVRDARVAIKHALAISKSKRVVVEEYLEGTHHGFSGFLRDGKIVFYFSDNEHYYINKYMVSGASTPSTVPQSALDELVATSEKIAQLLSLCTGIIHIQFVLRDNRPTIIEICRRAPGDLYIQFVSRATGIDYPLWIVKAATGDNCEGLSHSATSGYHTRHCVMGTRNGTVTEIVIDESVSNNNVDSMLWGQQGDPIDNYLIDKLGIVFLEYTSNREMNDKVGKLQTLIRPIIEDS